MSHSHGRQDTRDERWQQRQREKNRDEMNRNRLEHPPQGEHSGQTYDRETENRWETDPAQGYSNPRGGNSAQYNDEYDSRYDPRQRPESWQDPRPYDQDTSNREWVSGTGQPPYRGGRPQRSSPARETYIENRMGFENRQNEADPRSRDRSHNSRVPQESRQPSGMRQSFAGRGPQGYKRSDDRITEDISEEMTQDPDLDATHISVETNNGEVVLKGSVSDRESKRRAEEIAESCSGVKDVQNQIRVKRDGASGAETNSKSETDSKEDQNEGKRSPKLAS
jgi:osmotically-inducible protein OsmY